VQNNFSKKASSAIEKFYICFQEEVFGSVEAVKTVSDLFMPVSGEIIEFNSELEGNPEAVNTDPYGVGWMIKVKMSNPTEVNDLLDADSYAELIG